MRRILAALVGVAAMMLASPAAAATLVTNGSSQLTGVNGLAVGGTTYNVSFTDGTCAGLFSGCDAVGDFTFQSQADAQAAAAALLAAIVGSSFDTAPGTTFGCIGGEACSMLIPFGFTGSGDFSSVATLNGNPTNSSAINLFASPTAFDTGASTARVWALFAPVGVPEPASWAMMLLGFGAIGLAMRRRRRSLAAA